MGSQLLTLVGTGVKCGATDLVDWTDIANRKEFTHKKVKDFKLICKKINIVVFVLC